MGKITARNAHLVVYDGATSMRLTSSLNQITFSQTREGPEITVFETQNKERMTDGINDWEASCEGYYEGATGEIDAFLFGLLGGGSCLLEIGPAGSGASSAKYTGCAVLNNYEMSFQLEDAATVTANFQARTGSLTRGTY